MPDYEQQASSLVVKSCTSSNRWCGCHQGDGETPENMRQAVCAATKQTGALSACEMQHAHYCDRRIQLAVTSPSAESPLRPPESPQAFPLFLLAISASHSHSPQRAKPSLCWKLHTELDCSLLQRCVWASVPSNLNLRRNPEFLSLPISMETKRCPHPVPGFWEQSADLSWSHTTLCIGSASGCISGRRAVFCICGSLGSLRLVWPSQLF